MKLLMSVCAATALLAAMTGSASAQVEVRTVPTHAVPDDPKADKAPDAAQTAQAAGPSLRPESADRAVAALTAPAVTDAPLVSPQERAFFVALGRRLTDDAVAYEAYTRQAAAIDPRFTDSQSVQSALSVAERYNASQLQEGAIAYAAVLALRNQDFVDAVRAQTDSSLADRLISNPDAVFSIPGAEAAARDVAGVMHAQADAVKATGHAISEAAYSVQHQGWSRQPVIEPDRVLAVAKVSALTLSAADAPAERRLLDSIAAAPSGSGAVRTRSAQVTRGLALAAVAIMGRAGDAQEPRFESLLRELRNEDCLEMAKMNLNQCLAVAGPQYEDVFCLGQHAVGETGQCLVSAADDSQSPEGMHTAELDGYGSERAEAYGQGRP